MPALISGSFVYIADSAKLKLPPNISVSQCTVKWGAQWLSGRVLDLRPKGRGFEAHRRHCVVSLSKNINPSLVLIQPRKTSPFITERLLIGRKESKQTNKQNKQNSSFSVKTYYIY